MDKLSDPKIFEYITFQHDSNKDIMLEALNIVRDFIIANNLVITGGMAVDFALKLKGEKLYDDSTLPDYDFFSPEHHNHAYELGQILCRKLKYPNGDSPNISVIDALHITTMRVRINYISVADITYLPPSIFESLNKLTYNISTENGNKPILFRHPHIQMIDQHRALTLPYENTPREVILHRWKKDMKRFDLLYKHYPVEGKELDLSQFQRIGIDPDILQNNAVGGFAALYLLKNNTESFDIRIPKGEDLIIWSEKPENTAGKIMSIYREHSIKYFNPYLDLLPASMHITINRPEYIEEKQTNVQKKLAESEISGGDDESLIVEVNPKKFNDPLNIIIYDSTFKLITAEKHKNYYIIDSQGCLMYFLLKSSLEPNNSIYKDAYFTIAGLVENKIKKPTWEVYGSSNVGTEHVLQRTQTLAQNKEIPRIKIMLKPGRFFPSNGNCEIPTMLDSFLYDESPLFQIDGNEVKGRTKKIIDFLNPLSYDSSSGSDGEF